MILIIDNYDSFTYNLVQLARNTRRDVRVIRNDEKTVEEIRKLSPSHIIISSGSGHPKNAGICEDIIRLMKGMVPILGVGLGCQAICEVFGASIVPSKRLMHGKQSNIHIANGSSVFKGLPPIIQAARYHSLMVKKESLPDELLVIAEAEEGEVMGVKHRDYGIFGLQFNPESILTPHGAVIISNFLQIGGEVS
ncbi:MAG: aminodeoxychorismate/anthranilate synthase component II [Clostridiaceae bacterium]|nr:aminodeoxychorismate/anthranilate synthase component II [Clostridiaceae bacterium]